MIIYLNNDGKFEVFKINIFLITTRLVTSKWEKNLVVI